MPMGVTLYPLLPYLGSGLSYQRRFPVVYLTFKVLLRPQTVDKQHEVYAFCVSICMLIARLNYKKG